MDQIAPFALLMPLVGMFNGVVFFDESLTPSFLIGAGIVLCGLMITVFANESRGDGEPTLRINDPAG